MSDRRRLARFVLAHPSIARGLLGTAQRSLEGALRDVSYAVGAMDMVVEDSCPEPTERLVQALSSVGNAVSRMLRAARALEALRTGDKPARGFEGLCLCGAYAEEHKSDAPLCRKRQDRESELRDNLCACDAYSANHFPGRGNCTMRRV